MTIEQAVTDLLKATPTVTAIVGTRIRQLKLRQNETFPAVRVQLISDEGAKHLRGVERLKASRLMIDAYNTEASVAGSDPYAVVANLAEIIEGVLDGARFTVGNVRVRGAFQVLRRSDHEPGTQPLIRVQQDFRFRYERVS